MVSRKYFFFRNWQQLSFLTLLLFLVSSLISFLFPIETKLQGYIGIPFSFFAKGIFPWLGDLEDKTLVFYPQLFIDLIFWYIVSILILLVWTKLSRNR